MRDIKRIAWIGLGKLGLPMAARLVASGAQLVGFDRASERQAAARSRQVVVEEDLELLREADIVFTSLPDDAALTGAVANLLAVLEKGAILVETSTVSPDASAQVAAQSLDRGVSFLRAPVSGNPVLAELGELTVLASGPREAFEQARPAMATFSKAQHYLGNDEEARYAKLAINLMIAVSAGMMAEALTLAEKGGLAPERMLDVMVESAVASPMVKYKTPPLKKDDYSSTFSCRQMAKDLDLILNAARASNAGLPLAALLRETYSSLIAIGEGDTDFIAVVRHARRLAGLA